jgi:hypothetical protein
MFKKAMLSAMGLMTAVTGPIAYFSVSDYCKGGRTAANATRPATAATAAEPAPDRPPIVSTSPALDGGPVRNLADIFRFDLPPEWVTQRWPQVSVGLAQLQLQGYRVPLVTGTAETDLAGSLTYYFDTQQQLQRIAFRGTTGDARNMVGLLTGQYHFTRRLTNDPGLVLYETVGPDGRPGGSLRLHTSPLMKASERHQRFDVELVLDRPQE